MVFYAIMVTFWMTHLMHKQTNIVMDDGRVHPLAKILLSATYDEILQTFYSPLASWASPYFSSLDLSIPERDHFFFRYCFQS